MALDYLQYQVDQRWYRLFAAFMALVSGAIIILYVLAHVTSSLSAPGTTLGINTVGMVLSVVYLLYLGLLYRRISHYSIPFASLMGTLFFTLMLLNGLTQTEAQGGVFFYIILWAITIFFDGVYGLPILLGAVFVTNMYMFLQVKFDFTSIPVPSLILVGVSTMVAGASYFVWHKKFSNVDSQKVDQLSGMLRDNRKQSEVLTEFISDGIIVTNTEGKITLMNPAAAAMTEWSPEEANGIDAKLVVKFQPEEAIEVDENFISPLETTLTTQTSQNVMLQIVGRGGKQTTVSVAVSPIIPPDTKQLTGVVAVLRDISITHREEKQRADFISTASHEMRTPVAAIEGYLALALNEKVSKIDPKARNYLEKAHESTQHLGQLFQDLLTSAKAEDGRLVSHPTAIEMGAYLEQLTDSFRFSAQKKGLLTDFIIGASTGSSASSVEHVVRPLYYVLADPERLREVITNLFDNAVKYTPSGKVSMGITGNANVVQLYVRDTGPGIAAEDIPHLFQKFYRVDSTATRTIGGTGLGLFICRKIVEVYKGRIWVESEVGKGSSFYINLPRLSSQKAAELQSAEAQGLVSQPIASLTTPV